MTERWVYPICGADPHPQNIRDCRGCHNAYQRQWRKTHPLNAEQAAKARVRNTSMMLTKRGKLPRQPCKECGSEQNVERHHPLFPNPYYVVWLCRLHHRALHRRLKTGVPS